MTLPRLFRIKEVNSRVFVNAFFFLNIHICIKMSEQYNWVSKYQKHQTVRLNVNASSLVINFSVHR